MRRRKKMLIYVTAEKITVLEDGKGMDAIIEANIDFEGNEDWLDVEDDFDSCHSDDSYYSDCGSEDDMDVGYAGEFYYMTRIILEVVINMLIKDG
jgi:hypothetical protein